MSHDQQWPPARGIPAKARYKKAATLEWGETPFDDLDRGELLRLVQAYHAAAASAQGVLHQFRFLREQEPYWGPEGTGGRAWRRLEFLIRRAGDDGMGAASERVYRSFFRTAYGLLFPGLDPREQWGIDDATGEMVAPFVPGETSPLRPNSKLRAIRWSDLLPKRGGL